MKAPANLAEKLATFTDRFSPRTIANLQQQRQHGLEGPFHWHKHDETDDFFLVLKGTLDIQLFLRVRIFAVRKLHDPFPGQFLGRDS